MMEKAGGKLRLTDQCPPLLQYLKPLSLRRGILAKSADGLPSISQKKEASADV